VLCLPLLLQLFALGKIEVIMLLLFSCSGTCSVSLRPRNWNVESHTDLALVSAKIAFRSLIKPLFVTEERIDLG
jgi:hypothetical protein